MVFCTECGFENNDSSRCSNCGEYLTKKEFFIKRNYENFEDIFFNQNLIDLEELTLDMYDVVIENIKNIAKNSIKEINYYSTPLDKISYITRIYANINYKSRGAELGSYSFNSIDIDGRLDVSNQISTLIHELSHHLFSEIFEQLLMYLWGCGKTDALEAFVWFIFIANPVNKLMDEYCAHTCEGRFIPHGYQNYGSFNNIVIEEFNTKTDADLINFALIFGNTIAVDIIDILEEFIDENLREDIKQQFKKDYNYPPKYDEILLESKEVLNGQDKLENIIMILKEGFNAARDENMQEVLELFKINFEEVNNTSQ